ncbi:MAG: hypothetical protein ABIR70_17005 [Bryobacteraceae bacterium]
MKQRTKWLVGTGGIALLMAATAAWGQHDVTNAENSIIPSDHPVINYPQTPTSDPGELLNRKLQSGEVKLKYDDEFGYLPSLLKALNVNPDSQVLVFSKTSFQAVRISPRQPRAIYFNDNVSVGHVQGSDVLELATLDAKQGYIFYTFEDRKTDKPVFDRRDICLSCHHGPATAGIPGIMVASVYPDSSGMPFARLGMPATDHRTKFQDRWGGWYVTGTHGGQQHRGNAVARDRNTPDILDYHDTQNQMSLTKKFDTAPYLQKTSDIVALMTLEHQTRMSNLLTRLGWRSRVGDDVTDDIEATVTYMLFADEAPLLAQVTGSSTFTDTFPARGPRDPQGRSLRDFDLKTRIFRYPLSYMIYSDVFDALPTGVRERIYARVLDVLTAKTPEPKFAKLTPEMRRDILEILRTTKKGLPAAWLTAAAF